MRLLVKGLCGEPDGCQIQCLVLVLDHGIAYIGCAVFASAWIPALDLVLSWLYVLVAARLGARAK